MRIIAPLLLVIIAQNLGGQVLPLPPRPDSAPSRDQIIQTITPLARDVREDSLFNIITSGNVPSFLRNLVPVTSSATIHGVAYSVTYYVTPEYFSVGSDVSYFLTPMTPLLAQRLADHLHCILPTRKMVNDIYFVAGLKLAPAPIPPSAEMITVPVFVQHDTMVWAQRSPELFSYPLGTLVGGTHKDVVISNKIRNELKAGVPKPVVIYGWHQLDGTPIQPLYNGHGETYADYSHGIRLVQDSVLLNGSPTTISDILRDSTYSTILSDEGPIPFPRYGDPPTDVESAPSAPHGSMLFQNYPNPFNPDTQINYTIGAVGGQGSGVREVHLAVYDILGREVQTLVDREQAPGRYRARFDGSGRSSGIYFCRLTADAFSQTRTMLYIK